MSITALTEPASRARRERGVVLVELALTSTFLATLIFAGVEFSRAFQTYTLIEHSIQAGARYLTAFPPGDATAQNNAKNLVMYGSVTVSNPPPSPQVPGLNSSTQVVIADAANDASLKEQSYGSGKINLVRVTVSGVKFVSASSLLPGFTLKPMSVTLPQGI